MRKKLLIGAGSLAMLVLAAGVVLMTLALYRYGGVEGVVQRVRVEFAVEQPHDEYVPVPEDGKLVEADTASLSALAETLPTVAAPAEQPKQAAVATRAPVKRSTATSPQARLASFVQPEDSPARAEVQDAPTVAPTAAPTAAPTPFPPTMRLEGLAHYWQTWNNCGPATLSMNLSYFGIKIGQEKIGPVLKPEKDDKNVGPEQLAEYARSQGLNALVRVNGDSDRLKALLAAGVPILAETWYEPKPNDGMGHYRLIVGYDDAGGYWIAYDSYDSHGIKRGDPYRGVHFPYAEFDRLWKVFGRTYIPIYDAARAPAVEAVLGADLDDAAMWQRALAEDLADVKANPKDAFAWFNVGTDYVALGDYKAASQAYDTARQLKLPWRMLWYQFGPFKAYYEMGRHKEVIGLADATIKTAKNDEELFYWKALSQIALGDMAGGKASLQHAVKLRPTYQDAVDALAKMQ